MQSTKALFVFVAVCLPLPSGSVVAQQPCDTVRDCAQKALDAALSASNTATALNADMDDLKKAVQKIGAGSCTNTALGSKFEPTKAFYCPPGYYVNGIIFSHLSGDNFTYQENVSLFCCPIK